MFFSALFVYSVNICFISAVILLFLLHFSFRILAFLFNFFSNSTEFFVVCQFRLQFITSFKYHQFSFKSYFASDLQTVHLIYLFISLLLFPRIATSVYVVSLYLSVTVNVLRTYENILF